MQDLEGSQTTQARMVYTQSTEIWARVHDILLHHMLNVVLLINFRTVKRDFTLIVEVLHRVGVDRDLTYTALVIIVLSRLRIVIDGSLLIESSVLEVGEHTTVCHAPPLAHLNHEGLARTVKTDEQTGHQLRDDLPLALPEGDQRWHVKTPVQYGRNTVACQSVSRVDQTEFHVGRVAQEGDVALQDNGYK